MTTDTLLTSTLEDWEYGDDPSLGLIQTADGHLSTIAKTLKANKPLTYFAAVGCEDWRASATRELMQALIKHPELESLQISGKLRDAHAEIIAEALPKLPNLRFLNLSDNLIEENGAVALANAAQDHPSLVSLRVERNRIESPATSAYCDLIVANPRLGEVSLSGNRIDRASEEALAASAEASGNVNLVELMPCSRPERVAINVDACRPLSSLLRSGGSPLPRELRQAYQRKTGLEIYVFRNIESSHAAVNKTLAELDACLAEMPTEDSLKALTPEGLVTPNHDLNGLAPLDNPLVWERLPEITALLDAQQTPLTLEHLKQPDGEGNPYLVAGAQAGFLESVLAVAHKAGSRIGKAELIGDDGAPTALANHAFRNGTLPLLFRQNNWEGATAHELKSCVAALPEAMQQALPPLHALCTKLSRPNTSALGRD